MKNNKLFGRAKILDTDAGKQAAILLKESNKIGVSSRGIGTVDSSGIVEDTYRLLTFDIVSTPSVPGAYVNGILEGLTFDLDKVLDERTKMINERLKEQKQMEIWLRALKEKNYYDSI